jgi:hypothetical protein
MHLYLAHQTPTVAPSQKILAIRFNPKSQQRSLDALQRAGPRAVLPTVSPPWSQACPLEKFPLIRWPRARPTGEALGQLAPDADPCGSSIATTSAQCSSLPSRSASSASSASCFKRAKNGGG